MRSKRDRAVRCSPRTHAIRGVLPLLAVMVGPPGPRTARYTDGMSLGLLQIRLVQVASAPPCSLPLQLSPDFDLDHCDPHMPH